jgi:exosortase/archaeosortase family protein
LVLGAGFFAFVAWDQSYWWRTKEDYGFGWLVPVFVAYIVHQRWPKILQALQDCAASGSPRATGWHRAIVVAAAGACLAWGALWFLLGSFYRASAGPSQPGTLAITMGAVCIVSALLFFNAPTAAQQEIAPPWKDARLRLVSLFLFPVAVWLISAPLVSVVESAVNRFLLNQVVSVVGGVFHVLGLPIAQRGNVLLLPTGEVGVAEACSGIRSLTGCVFAGAFLAAAWLDQWWRKLLLFALAFPLAVFSNFVRALFLTSWAYRFGAAAIEGTLHDLTGYAVLGVTTLLLILAAHLLARR